MGEHEHGRCAPGRHKKSMMTRCITPDLAHEGRLCRASRLSIWGLDWLRPEKKDINRGAGPDRAPGGTSD